MQHARPLNLEYEPAEATVVNWCSAQKSAGFVSRTVTRFGAVIDDNKELNAFITTSFERAMAQAERSDERIRAGRERPLEGLPIAIKDNYCTFGIRTTAGSRILENFIPQYESGVTSRLIDAGAVFLGKTNMDEFAMGSSTETSAFGPTINPRGLSLGYRNYVPGGSSGGSAAAVAADLCLAALGSDTGGSIRQPASYCGVVGFKPTYGVCSRWGIIAYASSLDQAGVITKTVEDAALLMDVIAGPDARDSTSVERPADSFIEHLRADKGSPTVAIPRQFRDMTVNPDLELLWKEIENRLAKTASKVIYVDLPQIKYCLTAYYIIALCEASSNLARYDGVRYGYRVPNCSSMDDLYEQTRAGGFGWEVKRRILMGTYALSAGYYDQYYLKAAKVRRLIAEELSDLFREVDFLVWPTAPTSAFKIGEFTSDPIAMYLEDVFTVPVNLAGLPAISIPGISAASGMPMGFQVIGPRFSDARLLSFAAKLAARHEYED